MQSRKVPLPGINGANPEPNGAWGNAYAMDTVTRKELRRSSQIYYYFSLPPTLCFQFTHAALAIYAP